jgi:predicted enzyme related to lactoylglutathione lyase
LASPEVHVYVDVDDLERGIDFYTRGLGLRRGRRLDGNWIELLGASAPIHLLEKPAGSAPSTAGAMRRDYGRHWTPVHADFLVADLDAAVERAQAAGATLERGVQRREWNSMANLADPFGNGFDLLEEPGGVRAGAVDVAVDVADLDRAIAFYTGAVGLTLDAIRWPGAWAQLDAAGTRVHLMVTSEREYVRHWTPVHLDFIVANLDAATAQACAGGGVLERELQVHPWGRMANLADPFGNGFDLIAFHGRGYDALAL